MIVLTEELASFAADRKKIQENAISDLGPAVSIALSKYPASGWYTGILERAREVFEEVIKADGGDPDEADAAWRRLSNDLRTSLTKTASVRKASIDLIATYVSSAVINVATIEAAHQSGEPDALRWVTMHDDAVRPTHQVADGQVQRLGRKFHVGDAELRWPGDTRAPIGEWINCRCTLAPVAVPQSTAASVQTDVRPTRGEAMSTTVTEPEATDVAAPLPWYGVLAPEGVWSGDKRMFAAGSLSTRNLPLPLTWQKFSDEGHKQSVTVGSIEWTHKDEAGLLHAGGTFLQTPEADEVVGLIAHFGRYGVSVDADDAEFDYDEESDGLTFSKARVAGASVVGIPAFQEAFVMIGEHPDYGMTQEALAAAVLALAEEFGRGPGWVTNPEATKRIHDYWTVPGEEGYEKVAWGTPGDFNRCRVLVGEEIAENSPDKVRFLNQVCSQWHKDATGFWPGHAPAEQAASLKPEGEMGPAISLVASVAVADLLPAAVFADPEFDKVTPITFNEDGSFSGHLAAWGTCHTGFPKVCVQPPPSANDYAYFLTGEVLTDEGPIAVGNIVMGGGHAPHEYRINKALSYYDSTSTVVADCTVGEDDHGIWIAGMARNLDSDRMREFRASSLSGDWRTVRLPTGRSYELIAALCVNSPGFPVTRVGTYQGEQVTLVASAPAPDTTTNDQSVADFAEAVAAALEQRAARRIEIDALAAELELDCGCDDDEVDDV